MKITVADYDRVAPIGTGAYKVGGNYAASLKPQILAQKAGYADCVFLDAKTRTYIEEAVITPIGGIFYNEALHSFYADGQEVGPVTKKLYDRLTGIQHGEQEGPDGWVVEAQQDEVKSEE